MSNSYNVWIETEEVDDDGDQVQELDSHCHKLVHCESLEEVDQVFNRACNNHIAFARLKQFCELAASRKDDPEMQQLRQATLQGLRMVGLADTVE